MLRILPVLLPLSWCAQSRLSRRRSTTARIQLHIVNSEKHELQAEMTINVVTDCGAVGDGVTDDWAAIQACITNHPKTISFRRCALCLA